MLWLAGFCILAVIGLLLAAYSRDEDARLLATALAVLAGFAGLCWDAEAMYVLPGLDCLIACMAFVLWEVRRAAWLRAFVVLAAARLVIHVGVSLTGPDTASLFYHLLNATFAAQVFLVSKQGGLRLGRAVFSGLRDVRVAVSSQANVGHG